MANVWLGLLTNMDGVEMRLQFNVAHVRDNVVGFLSQIGWGSLNEVGFLNKKISMEKIFVDVDTNGGNGGKTFVWEAIMGWLFGDALLHSKIPHRIPVCEKVKEYLEV